MEERNAQIEKEDEEKKAEELKERKRKVLGMLWNQINDFLYQGVRVEKSSQAIQMGFVVINVTTWSS